MKQFGKIFKFELKGYLKNKVFVGVTIFLVIAIVIASFIPNIISHFSSDGGQKERPIMIVYSDDAELSQLVKQYFGAAFADYEIQLADSSVDDIKQQIVDGNAQCAFVLDSASSYTYYVNNLSLYDNNIAIANSVLQEVYRINAMLQNGLTDEQVGDIMSVQIHGSTTALGKDQSKNLLYTYVMIFALYIVIMLYGQMVANNVATEKSSRAMELLITSAKPTNMMFGKVIASCVAGLMQLVAVFGTALLMYTINKTTLSGNTIMLAIFSIPADLFIYLLVFFILGFLIYAFLYGALGSTVSKLEDTSTAVMPITYVFIAAFLIVTISMGSGNVDNLAMKICSYIPFTSPMAMFTRIAMSTVAWYEIAISIGILTASVIGFGVVAARIYRVGVLMYGTRPKLGAILKSVFKKS